MTKPCHSATSTLVRWPLAPENWSNEGIWLGSMRHRGPILGAALFALVTFILGAGALHRWWLGPGPAEVAVFFPGTSDEDWTDFVAGLTLAAAETGSPIRAKTDPGLIEVDVAGQPLLFRWYPEVGSGGIRRRVAEICARSSPPLAIVGANNTALTQSVASALAQCPADGPLLLMTTATQDELVARLPGRAFRFGFNNTYQARVVTRRLRELLGASPPPRLMTIAVASADDPFSEDLSDRMLKELSRTFSVQPVKPPAAFSGRSEGSRSTIWWLPTTTGGYQRASDQEVAFARSIATAMRLDASAEWILILPVGLTPLRRIGLALGEELQELGCRPKLVILSGDSLDYQEFAEADRNQLPADRFPGTVIFFAHANPLDPSASGPPGGSIGARCLDRDLARALLRSLAALGPPWTPSRLGRALSEHASGPARFFEANERREGGGAIVAIPRRDLDHFELSVPAGWRVASR